MSSCPSFQVPKMPPKPPPELGCSAPTVHCVHASNKPSTRCWVPVWATTVPLHKPPAPGDGVTLGQQHRWSGGKSGCPKSRAPQSQSKQLSVPVHFGATLVSSPPSWVQGDQGQCACGQRWPWGCNQPGNLCALSRGLRGQGASAMSRPPSSSRCSGDSDVRPFSDVPIPHCPAGGPAAASVPPLGVLRTGFGHSPFGKGLGCHYVLSQQCFPTCQHPAGT